MNELEISNEQREKTLSILFYIVECEKEVEDDEKEEEEEEQ